MDRARTGISGWAIATSMACLAGATAAGAAAAAPADEFYAALLGEPAAVDGALLVAAPGRFVGHAVRTRGRLRTVDASALRFDLALGTRRARLHLEPEARGALAAHGTAWDGKEVEVEGLFYRDADGPAGSGFALRVWRVGPLGAALREDDKAPGDAPAVTLEEVVYGGGRYDGRLVRVRGSYRGPNRHRDLPEASRRGRGDWVIKDGYFAAWITGHEARGEGWDLIRRSAEDAEAVVDVLGVPTTAGGVVRIAARRIDLAPDGVVASGARATPRAAGALARSPSLTFAYPVPGEPLRPGGRMILQFSKALDPPSLESRIRVRYERDGVATAAPRVVHRYRDRDRTLLVTPRPAPPPGTDVVVELLEGIIDVDGRALVRASGRRDGGEPMAADVVDRVRFRSAR
jgi:hypothetical protein